MTTINFEESDKKTALELIGRKPNTTADHLSESTDIGGINSDYEDARLEIDRILTILQKEGKITTDNPDAEFVKYRLTKQEKVRTANQKAIRNVISILEKLE